MTRTVIETLEYGNRFDTINDLGHGVSVSARKNEIEVYRTYDGGKTFEFLFRMSSLDGHSQFTVGDSILNMALYPE